MKRRLARILRQLAERLDPEPPRSFSISPPLGVNTQSLTFTRPPKGRP